MSERYSAWRVPQLWTMVAEDDGHYGAHHQLTWERQYGVLIAHGQRLKALREDLAERWPPEHSEAARAFLDRITDMIQLIDRASYAVAQIWDNLGHITAALQQARAEIQPLMASYHDQDAAWEAFNASAMPMPNPVVGSIGSALGFDRPVLANYQRELDERARDIMQQADDVVAQASARFATVPSYQPDHVSTLDSSFGSDGSGGPTGANVRELPFIAIPPFDTPPLPHRHDETGSHAINGPTAGTLSQAANVVTPPPLVSAATAIGAAAAIGSLRRSGDIASHTRPRIPPTTTTITPTGSRPGQLRTTTSGQSPLRPGGIIGPPMAGSPRPISPADRPPDTQVARRTARYSVSTDWRGIADRDRSADGGWRDRQYEEYVERRRPSRALESAGTHTREGAPALLEPGSEPTHDPGPGVIGIDR